MTKRQKTDVNLNILLLEVPKMISAKFAFEIKNHYKVN